MAWKGSISGATSCSDERNKTKFMRLAQIAGYLKWLDILPGRGRSRTGRRQIFAVLIFAGHCERVDGGRRRAAEQRQTLDRSQGVAGRAVDTKRKKTNRAKLPFRIAPNDGRDCFSFLTSETSGPWRWDVSLREARRRTRGSKWRRPCYWRRCCCCRCRYCSRCCCCCLSRCDCCWSAVVWRCRRHRS